LWSDFGLAPGWEIATQGTYLGELTNNRKGFEQLAERVQQEQKQAGADTVLLVMEPTGGYEQALAHFALEQGWRVSLPNPRRVREWARGMGRRAKTDKQDAILWAHYGWERKPPAWAPMATEASELSSLLQRKGDLEQMLRQERQRQQGWSERAGVAADVLTNVASVIGALEQALREVEQAIRAHLRKHAELAEQARRLESVPGIGEKSVLPVLVLLHRWDALTQGTGSAKKLGAYAGLDAQTEESGTTVRGRETISRMGDRQMRARLYMCALGGVKGQSALRQYYERLVGRGKAKKVALVAASRKILMWAWAVFRDHVSFQAEKTVPRAA
jgi:transposase